MIQGPPMLPDFTAPAFGFLAICSVRFRERKDGSPRTVLSDYRCQEILIDFVMC
jgi:hypothetical protein